MPPVSLQLDPEVEKEVEVNQHSPTLRPEQVLDCIDADIKRTQAKIRDEAKKMDDRKWFAKLSFSF